MRASSSKLILSALLGTISWCAQLHAQPTWRFHLAFENGDGARDTIWLVYDTTATLGSFPFPGPNVDTLLGEGRVEMDHDTFNVWMINAVGDSTKTRAFPYWMYPVHEGNPIDAMNWEPPITIRWDTALFRAPYLPGPDTIGLAIMGGTYFFFNNNHPELQAFDMLLTDSVVVNTDVDLLFQFGVSFGAHNGIGIAETNEGGLRIGPNPTAGQVRWDVSISILRAAVIDQLGRTVISSVSLPSTNALDLSGLPDGLYILHLLTNDNRHYHARIIKQADH